MMAPSSDSPPAETQENEQQEQINPIEWAGSGTAGRVTQRNQANTTAERLMSIMANTQRALSPAGSSEGGDPPSSSSSSASRTQQLGAPPGAENMEGRWPGKGGSVTIGAFVKFSSSFWVAIGRRTVAASEKRG